MKVLSNFCKGTFCEGLNTHVQNYYHNKTYKPAGISPYTESAKYIYFQNEMLFHIVKRHLYQGVLYICMMNEWERPNTIKVMT